MCTRSNNLRVCLHVQALSVLLTCGLDGPAAGVIAGACGGLSQTLVMAPTTYLVCSAGVSGLSAAGALRYLSQAGLFFFLVFFFFRLSFWAHRLLCFERDDVCEFRLDKRVTSRLSRPRRQVWESERGLLGLYDGAGAVRFLLYRAFVLAHSNRRNAVL